MKTDDIMLNHKTEKSFEAPMSMLVIMSRTNFIGNSY